MYLNPLEGNQLQDPFLEGAEIPAVRFACHESYPLVVPQGTYTGYTCRVWIGYALNQVRGLPTLEKSKDLNARSMNG